MTWLPVARPAHVPRENIRCRTARERLARHLELLERHLVDVGRRAEASAVRTDLRLVEALGECCGREALA